MRHTGIIFFIFFALNAWCSYPERAVFPERIASVNLCIDQLLWQMVGAEHPERLVSLSYLSADRRWSPIADELKTHLSKSSSITLNHGLAEELILQAPDLVLAGDYDSAYTLDLLTRFNYRVLRFSTPQNIQQVKQQIRDLGKLLGLEDKANLLVDRINKQLDQAAQHKLNYAKATAYWYTANGIVIGQSSLENDLMHTLGLRNLAVEQGIEGFAQLDLEILLTTKPDIIILEESQATAFSLAREFMQHPALLKQGAKVIELPANLSGCAASLIGDITSLFANLKTESHRNNVYDQTN